MATTLLAHIQELFNQQKYREVSSLVNSQIDKIENLEDKKQLLLLSAKSNYLLSQNKQALENILACKQIINWSTSTVEEIVEIDIQRAKILRRLGEKDKSLNIYDKILKDYQDILNENTKATIFHNLGNLYLEKGAFEQSKELFEQAIQIDEKNKNERGLAQSFSSLGGLYFYLGEYNQAIEYYNKSLKIRAKNKNLIGEATLLFNLGSTYANMLNEENAISYLNKAEKIFNKIGHKKGEKTVLDSKARMFYNLKKYSSVIKNLDYLRGILSEKITPQNLPMILLLIESLLKSGDTAEANETIDKTLEATKSFDDETKGKNIAEIANLMHLKSQFWFKKNEYDKSLEVLEELEKLAIFFKDDESLIAIYFSKSQVFYTMDDLEKSEELAKTGLKLAIKHKNPTLFAYLDLLFGISWKQSSFSKCTEYIEELVEYVQTSRKPILNTILRALQLAQKDKIIKTHEKEFEIISEDYQLLLLYQDLLAMIHSGKIAISKIEKLINNIKPLKDASKAQLTPYIILILNMTQIKQEKLEKILPLIQNSNQLYSLFSRISRKQVLFEDIQDTIEKKKAQKTISFYNMMIILDIIFYSIIFGFISKKYLLEFDWSTKVRLNSRKFIQIKQSFLVNILKDDAQNNQSLSQEVISNKNANQLFNQISQNILDKQENLDFESKTLIQGIIADFVVRIISLISSGELSGTKTQKADQTRKMDTISL